MCFYRLWSYGSLVETSIVLVFVSSILKQFFIFIKIGFIDLFIFENYTLSTHSYTM